jgi:hypothetical protein
MIDHHRRKLAELYKDADPRHIEALIGERDRLRAAIQEFVGKHFHGGSKANRPDYTAMVPTEDIYKLRAAAVGEEP